MDSEETGPGITPAPRNPILELPDPFAGMKRERMIHWHAMKDAQKIGNTLRHKYAKIRYEKITADLIRQGEV